MDESQTIDSLSKLCAALELHDKEGNAVDVSSIEQAQYNPEDVADVAKLLGKGLGVEVALSWQAINLWVGDEWDQELRYPFTITQFWQTVYGLHQSESWRIAQVAGIECLFIEDNQQFKCAGVMWQVVSHDPEKVKCVRVGNMSEAATFSWQRISQCIYSDLLEPSDVVEALLLGGKG